MQKGFAPLFILVGILILAIVSGGAYFLGKLPIKSTDNSKKACTQEAKICPDGSSVGRTGPNCEFDPCPSASPKASDETAAWKTYSNTKYGYKVNYPVGKVEFDEESPQHRDLVHIAGIYIDTTESYKETIILSIRVWEDLEINIKDMSNRDRWCYLIESQLAKEEYSQIGCNYQAAFTEKTIDGIKAFETTGGRDNSLVSVFYIPNRGYVYQIEITTGGGSGEVKFPLSNQILSTFKFLP